MNPESNTDIPTLKDRSELAKIYPQVVERGGVRQDIPIYRNPAYDSTESVAVVPFRPFKVMFLGAIYSCPLLVLLYLLGFGEYGMAMIVLVIVAAAVVFISFRLVHPMVQQELEALHYDASSVLRVYWLGLAPLTLTFARLFHLKFALTESEIAGCLVAAVLLFAVAGYILARVTKHRFTYLWIVVAICWAIPLLIAALSWLLA